MSSDSSAPPRPEAMRSVIYATIRRIPHGRVATYGQIALLAGLGRRARMVGRALRDFAEADRVPWQRVVNSQGRISLRPAHHDEPELHQRILLEAEGVEFKPSGRIDLGRFRWDPGPQEAGMEPSG